jgi:hypothetical protein
MRHALRTSRLVGLLTLVMGMTALGGTAAQAEPGAFWKVNNSQIPSNLLPELQATIEGPHGILLTKVGLSKVEILCTTIGLKAAKLHELGRITGKAHFSGCITKLNGTTANACVPHSPGAANGLIETNALHGLLKLHKLADGKIDDIIEVLPEGGLLFVTLVLGKAAPEKNECAIGEKFDITGHAYLKDCQDELLKEKVEHLLEEGPLTLLLFGANPATIDGTAFVSLAGVHKGLTWSGWPF